MKQLYLGPLMLLMAGCSHAPKYAPPADAPQAQIRSELGTLDNHRNSLRVYDKPTVGCKFGSAATVIPGRDLFSVSDNKSTPEGFRTIEAGRPISLILMATISPDRYCGIAFTGEFAPGARYVMKGGIIDAGLNRLGSCLINIVDLDSGVPVHLIRSPVPEPSSCALPKLLRQVL